ncbi:hypothetical protein HUG17_5087 [Dermatophagoides farinae]|uniref:MH2 domain-containing protein n=1 Tax=Dermatophagoides farinae TaxID=6954 RepID=A0A9D4P1T2_DERFA|nr:hypothetical protein HUG17_5087 [Dermatophagoides farinae]
MLLLSSLSPAIFYILQSCFCDQLQEIRNKWNQIDDEIWAKIICFERNRRVAKAYARSQVISITGSDRGFDGYRIGLNGFPNPKRDFEVQMIKQQIRSGFKLKIDDLGNVHIKRIGRCPVFLGPGIPVGNSDYYYSQQQQLQQRQHEQSMIALEMNKPRMIFDFKKFQQSMISILSQQQQTPLKNSGQRMNPFHNLSSSSSLENQCVHHIQLMADNEEHHQYLRHPCWILLINIVALDLFWSKFKLNGAFNPVISRKLFTSELATDHHCRVPLKAKNPLYDPCEDDYFENNNSHRDHCSNHCLNLREKVSDDLYYCGYAAKISNSSNHRQSSSTTIAKHLLSSIPIHSSSNISPIKNGSLENKKLSASATAITTMPIKTKSRYIPLRPNPMKQLPTFNRIGLEQSKRLFFSSHQLSNGQINEHQDLAVKHSDDKIKHVTSLKKYSSSNRSNSKYSSSSSTSSSSTTSYSPHHQRFNHNHNRHHHQNRFCTSSKLHYRMKQTYRSTCDLLSN